MPDALSRAFDVAIARLEYHAQEHTIDQCKAFRKAMEELLASVPPAPPVGFWAKLRAKYLPRPKPEPETFLACARYGSLQLTLKYAKELGIDKGQIKAIHALIFG